MRDRCPVGQWVKFWPADLASLEWIHAEDGNLSIVNGAPFQSFITTQHCSDLAKILVKRT